MKKVVAILTFFISLNCNLFAQILMFDIDCVFIESTLYNQYDINNKKTGIWIESSQQSSSVSIYTEGEKNVIQLLFSKNKAGKNSLEYIRNYRDDKLEKMVWIPDKNLYYIVDSIRVNNSLIKEQKFWLDLDTLYESYVRYYEKGKLKEEGWSIYPEYLELDSEDVGMWKIYDDKGNVYLEERGKKVLPNFRK